MLPDYWIERPPMRLDAPTRSAIEEFLASGAVDVSKVTLWKFLCGLAERRAIAFHGTGDPDIERFEPRQPIDHAPFGNQEAVFATSDPIWAMFYAIVDRERYEITLNNGCIALLDSHGRPGTAHYYFSISRDALPLRPWRTGYVYLLPAETFIEQPSGMYGGHLARVPQLASPVAVRPFACFEVAPSDFPFLPQIRGHDDDRLAEYATAIMAADPWPEER